MARGQGQVILGIVENEILCEVKKRRHKYVINRKKSRDRYVYELDLMADRTGIDGRLCFFLSES